MRKAARLAKARAAKRATKRRSKKV